MTEASPPNATPVEVRIFSKSPLVLIGACDIAKSRPVGAAAWISAGLAGRPYWLFLKVNWSLERTSDVERLADGYARHAAEHPEHRIIYMCNTARELLALQRQRVLLVLE